jgi:hypothetical protein
MRQAERELAMCAERRQMHVNLPDERLEINRLLDFVPAFFYTDPDAACVRMEWYHSVQKRLCMPFRGLTLARFTIT